MASTTLLGALSFQELWADYSAELSIIIFLVGGLGICTGLVFIYLLHYRRKHVYPTSYVDERMTTPSVPVWEFRRYKSLTPCPELPGMSTIELRRTDVPIRERGEFYFALTWLTEDTIDIVPNTVRRNKTKKRQFHELQTACYLLNLETPVEITLRLRPSWTLCNYAALGLTVALGLVGGPLIGAYYGILVAMLPLGLCIAVLVYWVVDYHIHPATKQGYCQYLFVNPYWPKQDVVGFTIKFWKLEKKKDMIEGEELEGDGVLEVVGELKTIPVSLIQLIHMIEDLHGKTIKILSVDLELVDRLPKVIKEDYGTSLLASRTPVGMRELVREISKVKTLNSVLRKNMADLEREAAEAEIKSAKSTSKFFRFLTDALAEINRGHREIHARAVGVQNVRDYERAYNMSPRTPDEAPQPEIMRALGDIQATMATLGDRVAQQEAGLLVMPKKKRWWRRGK